MARCPRAFGALLLLTLAASAGAQTAAETEEDEAVGQSLNYVFATDLGSGVYDLGGRTLQIYRLTYEKELRPVDEDTLGVSFVMPWTFGFFDFDPLDVLHEGIPTRVDSFSVVPGFEFDHLMQDDWHLVTYLRAGASVASSRVDGWLYGVGVRMERERPWRGWDAFVRTEFNYSGVGYRQDVPSDEFARARQGINLARGMKWTIAGRELEFGMYGILDFILDPPTVPVVGADQEPLQAEFGITFSTRPPFKIWRWDAPRLGFGYRFAGDLSAWHFLIGVPF
jgi:hypothetical protein